VDAPSAVTVDGRGARMLDEIIERARADAAFAEIKAKFDRAGIENWLLEDEKALHFGVGAFAPGGGTIVEIGTYQGASACFLAAGIARRRHGRLFSVDPHFGGPPWLGMAPHQRTLEKFREGTRFCGVADWIESRIGDSAAVAAVWPAQPIDAVFIDADHSFLGALKDFECWAPKVKPGGLVMFDDADDPALPELLDLIEFIKTLRSVTHLRTVQGVAVFRVNAVGTGKLARELSEAAAARGSGGPGTCRTSTACRSRPTTLGRSPGTTTASTSPTSSASSRGAGPVTTATPPGRRQRIASSCTPSAGTAGTGRSSRRRARARGCGRCSAVRRRRGSSRRGSSRAASSSRGTRVPSIRRRRSPSGRS
jgi:predicted O-methyltransferase YrrM